MGEPISLDTFRAFVDQLYIAAPGTRLRREDEKKCLELRGLLQEIERAALRSGRGEGSLNLVDAAAGKGYVGLSVAGLLGPRLQRSIRVTFIEREERRAAAIVAAGRVLGLSDAAVEVRRADVGDPAAWPQDPDLVVALHACGDATDRVVERATVARAKWVLAVPCCVASWLPAARRGARLAEQLGMPRHAEVRSRHVEAHVLAERVWALESAGWQTETVSFAGPTVTPYNVLLRARRVGEPRRMQAAREALQRLRGSIRG